MSPLTGLLQPPCWCTGGMWGCFTTTIKQSPQRNSRSIRNFSQYGWTASMENFPLSNIPFIFTHTYLFYNKTCSAHALFALLCLWHIRIWIVWFNLIDTDTSHDLMFSFKGNDLCFYLLKTMTLNTRKPHFFSCMLAKTHLSNKCCKRKFSCKCSPQVNFCCYVFALSIILHGSLHIFRQDYKNEWYIGSIGITGIFSTA